MWAGGGGCGEKEGGCACTVGGVWTVKCRRGSTVKLCVSVCVCECVCLSACVSQSVSQSGCCCLTMAVLSADVLRWHVSFYLTFYRLSLLPSFIPLKRPEWRDFTQVFFILSLNVCKNFRHFFSSSDPGLSPLLLRSRWVAFTTSVAAAVAANGSGAACHVRHYFLTQIEAGDSGKTWHDLEKDAAFVGQLFKKNNNN